MRAWLSTFVSCTVPSGSTHRRRSTVNVSMPLAPTSTFQLFMIFCRIASCSLMLSGRFGLKAVFAARAVCCVGAGGVGVGADGCGLALVRSLSRLSRLNCGCCFFGGSGRARGGCGGGGQRGPALGGGAGGGRG